MGWWERELRAILRIAYSNQKGKREAIKECERKMFATEKTCKIKVSTNVIRGKSHATIQKV